MEVHHHSHAGKGSHWKNIVSEFLMLFLAVFCGFLAEYQLEHVVEKNREEQLMRSMMADLQTNEELLLKQKVGLITRKTSCDSIGWFLESERIRTSGADIYYHARRLGFYTNQNTLATRSLDQLKHGGMFRLIRITPVADSLSYYDNSKNQYELMINWYIEEVKKIQEANKSLFDAHVFERSTTYQDQYHFTPLRPEGNPALLSYDAARLQDYYNTVYYLKRNTEVLLQSVDNMLAMSQRMRKLIADAYHL